MKKSPITILFFLLIFQNMLAQKEPMKYGKVEKADLEMTVYPADSSAAAVVLCNYGYYDSNNMQFVHQRRIKILKEEGKDYANLAVPGAEKTNVKGQTLNMENGKPVITKLSKEGIFIDRITKNVYSVRVAMPNVKVGSIIDVEYYFEGIPPHYWSFQERIPVRWSELVLEENTLFSCRKTMTGYIALAESSDGRWVAKNVPAFKSEPYINNYENYLSRLNIEISSIHIPGAYYKDYATTWGAVAKALRDDEDFGMQLTALNFYLNGLEKEIRATTSTPEERLNKAYDAIKKIKWDKNESIWPSKNGMSYAFNKKNGNAADINLNLILLLRKLDIQANPVVLSTRDNGILPPYSVSFDKLNYVIAQAVIGEKTYLLDATDENIPIGLLPERTINGKGLVINKETQDWVDLTPQKKDKSSTMLILKLGEDGILKGDWKKSSFDFGALDVRENYKSFNSQDEYLKDIESDNLGLSVENYKIDNLDSIQQPVKEEFSIILKNRITKINNQMYFNPFLFDKYTENPFKAEDRVYPVDFVTPIEKTQLLSLDLPEGYSIEQLPKNIKMVLPENGASFSMQSTVNENKVQVLFKLNINKPVFFQKDYRDLKTFFDELVKKQAEMLIIKKV